MKRNIVLLKNIFLSMKNHHPIMRSNSYSYGKDIPSGNGGRFGASSADRYGVSLHLVGTEFASSFSRNEKQSNAFAAAAFIACFLVSLASHYRCIYIIVCFGGT